MSKRRWHLLALVGLVLLCGCGQLFPPERRGRAALDEFTAALRWQKYAAAAEYMQPQYREEFLNRFKSLRDLTIVDVRQVETQLAAEGRRAEVVLEMDYFLLPSVTVETLRIEQVWVYFDQQGPLRGRYQIVSPFPAFP